MAGHAGNFVHVLIQFGIGLRTVRRVAVTGCTRCTTAISAPRNINALFVRHGGGITAARNLVATSGMTGLASEVQAIDVHVHVSRMFGVVH